MSVSLSPYHQIAKDFQNDDTAKQTNKQQQKTEGTMKWGKSLVIFFSCCSLLPHGLKILMFLPTRLIAAFVHPLINLFINQFTHE